MRSSSGTSLVSSTSMASSTCYQLSADLEEKQLQLLQRKYGGPRVANQAAITIQTAFRRHLMARKLANLTASCRLSSGSPSHEKYVLNPHHHHHVLLHHHHHHHVHHHRHLPHHLPLCVVHRQRSFGSSSSSASSSNNNDHNKGLNSNENNAIIAITNMPSSASSVTASATVTPSTTTKTTPTSMTTPTLITKSPPTVTSPKTSPSMSSFSRSNVSSSEVLRKRHYRTGLNLFNQRPERGINFLISQGFLDASASSVARFLLTRKGLSKQRIGEYLGNLSHTFNAQVLDALANEVDLSGLHIDVALRKFQTLFRMPGEAQKIERIVEVFSRRYIECNANSVRKRFRSQDAILILAFAIILLNTDLHTPNLKPEKRMKVDEFVRNLRGVDGGRDIESELLSGIYERIRVHAFKPGSDHVTQVSKVQETIVSKCPNLAVPHRRLVCYCRLYELADPYKKERPGQHQREVFLFNDLLVITKIAARKKNSVTYAFRQSLTLAGLQVSLFETQFYAFGIQVAQKWDRKLLLMMNARNEHDRSKFVEDLKESIAEMDELETIRLETELEKQPPQPHNGTVNKNSSASNNNGSVPVGATSRANGSSGRGSGAHGRDSAILRRSAINNSLLDLASTETNMGCHSNHNVGHFSADSKMARRGSMGSLDSGMSVSFQVNDKPNPKANGQTRKHR